MTAVLNKSNNSGVLLPKRVVLLLILVFILLLVFSVYSHLLIIPAAVLVLYAGLQSFGFYSQIKRFVFVFSALCGIYIFPSLPHTHWQSLPWFYFFISAFFATVCILWFPLFFDRAKHPSDQFGFPVLFTATDLIVKSLFPGYASALSYGIVDIKSIASVTAVVGSGGLTFLMSWTAGAIYFEGRYESRIVRWIAALVIIGGSILTLGRFDQIARQDFPNTTTVYFSDFKITGDSVWQNYTTQFFRAVRNGATLINCSSVIPVKRASESGVLKQISQISRHESTAQIMTYQLDSRKHPSVVYVDSTGRVRLLQQGVYRLYPGPHGLGPPVSEEFDPLRNDTEQAGPSASIDRSKNTAVPEVKYNKSDGPGQAALVLQLGRRNMVQKPVTEPIRFSRAAILWNEKEPDVLRVSAFDAQSRELSWQAHSNSDGLVFVQIPLEWDRWPVLRKNLAIACIFFALVILVFGLWVIYRNPTKNVTKELKSSAEY